jgi:hypothetical protein
VSDFHKRMKKRASKNRQTPKPHQRVAFLRAGDENWTKGCERCGGYPSIYRPNTKALCRDCGKGGKR